jgi:hypothetical protein
MTKLEKPSAMSVGLATHICALMGTTCVTGLKAVRQI